MADILFHGISVGKFRVDTLSSSQFQILLSLCTRLAHRFLVRNRLDFIIMPQKAKIGTRKSRIWNTVIILFGNQKSKSNQYGMIYDLMYKPHQGLCYERLYIHSRVIHRSVAPIQFILELCTKTPCWCPPRWATIGRSRSNRNICQWVLLLKRKVINPDTLKIILLQAQELFS